jgi:Ca2+-dependent lipid-binding protein
MMYNPNFFRLNLEQLLSGTPLNAAIGVLRVTVQSARSIKASKFGGASPDPYVSLSISDRKQLACTKYKHNTINPTWVETKFLILNSLADSLVLSVHDYNELRKDTHLGNAIFELEKLKVDTKQEGIESPILKDGKDRGQLRYDVSFYPVLKLHTANGKEELPETSWYHC